MDLNKDMLKDLRQLIVGTKVVVEEMIKQETEKLKNMQNSFPELIELYQKLQEEKKNGDANRAKR